MENFCGSCGTKYPGDDKFCNNCGATRRTKDATASSAATSLVATAVRRGSLAAVTTTERRKSIAADANVDVARCASAAADLQHIFRDVLESSTVKTNMGLFLLVSGGSSTADEMHFLHAAELIEEDYYSHDGGNEGGDEHTFHLAELSEEERHFLFIKFVAVNNQESVSAAEFHKFIKGGAGGSGGGANAAGRRKEHRRGSVAMVAGLEAANAEAAAKSGACPDGIKKEDHFRINAEETVARGRKRRGTMASRMRNKRKRNLSKRAAIAEAAAAEAEAEAEAETAASPAAETAAAAGAGGRRMSAVQAMTDDELHAAIATAEAEARAHEARDGARRASVSDAARAASEAAKTAAAAQRGRRGSVARALAVLGAAATRTTQAATAVVAKAKGALGAVRKPRKRRGTVMQIAPTNRKKGLRGSAIERRRRARKNESAEARAERIRKRHARGTELLDELAQRGGALTATGGGGRACGAAEDFFDVKLGAGALGFEVGWSDGHLSICGFLSRKQTATALTAVRTKSAENAVSAEAEAVEAAEAAEAESESGGDGGGEGEGGGEGQGGGDDDKKAPQSIASRSKALHLNDEVIAANGTALPDTFEAARVALAEARAATPQLLVLGVRRRRPGPSVVSRKKTCMEPLRSVVVKGPKQPGGQEGQAEEGGDDESSAADEGQKILPPAGCAGLGQVSIGGGDNDGGSDYSGGDDGSSSGGAPLMVTINKEHRRVDDLTLVELQDVLRDRGLVDRLIPPLPKAAAAAAGGGCFGWCSHHHTALSQMLVDVDGRGNKGREFKVGDTVEASVHADGEWEHATIQSILKPPSYAQDESPRVCLKMALDDAVEFLDISSETVRFPLRLINAEVPRKDLSVLAAALERRLLASGKAEDEAARVHAADDDSDESENPHDAFFSTLTLGVTGKTGKTGAAPPPQTYASETNPATGEGAVVTCLGAVKEEFRASFAEILQENGVDDAAILLLTESDLEAMGCKALWPRRQLATAIQKLNGERQEMQRLSTLDE